MSKYGDLNIWERQEGESEKAYQAFSIYRDKGTERTAISVANELHKSYTLIRRWKDNFNWEERVRAYDNWIEREALEKSKKAAIEAQTKMRKRHIKLATELQAAAMTALDEKKIKDMSPKDIIRFISVAVEIEQQNVDAEVSSFRENTDTTENETLKKLDEVLGEIESAF